MAKSSATFSHPGKRVSHQGVNSRWHKNSCYLNAPARLLRAMMDIDAKNEGGGAFLRKKFDAGATPADKKLGQALLGYLEAMSGDSGNGVG